MKTGAGCLRRLRAGAILLLALVPISCATRRAPGEWEAVEVPTDADFRGLWFTDSLRGWTAGGGYAIEGGIVGRTADGGRSWRFESGITAGGGTNAALGRMQMRDPLHGCVVGAGGLALLTDDGGETWRPVRRGRSPGDALTDVQFLDDRTGWASGPASVVRTEDGGESWHPLVYGGSENGYLSAFAIHFTGESCGWIVGERGTIFHTTDGGTTWSRQTNGVPIVRAIPKGEPPRPREPIPELETEPDRLTLSAVQFLDEDRGCAVGYYTDVGESVILGTADGGASWRVEKVVPGEYLRALFVLDARHAWAAGDRARSAPQVILRYVGSGR